MGIDVVKDDLSVNELGIHTFSTPKKTWSFDIEYHELIFDAEYRITVYAKSVDGVWDIWLWDPFDFEEGLIDGTFSFWIWDTFDFETGIAYGEE